MADKNKVPHSPSQSPSDSAQSLRQRAEEKVRQAAGQLPEDSTALAPEGARRLVHELRVHQIELEMQNEELRRAGVALEASRARYFDLYDLAPTGYLTISEKGIITESNLAAAKLLGLDRSQLVNQPMSRFILPEDQDIYYHHRKLLFKTIAPQGCEFRMMRADSVPFWVRLETVVGRADDGSPVCHTVISDIAERRLMDSYREMGREVLRILNESGNFQDSIQRIVAALKTRTGFDAVGI
jgi:PAS domain S-box-containing protein